MEKIEAPEESDRRIKFRFPQPQRSGQRVLQLKKIHHAYGTKVVYEGIDFTVERGDRTVLVGPNGAGKSTLLKILAGVIPFQQGEREPGHNCHVGYYSQNRVEMLQPSRTVLEEVMDTRQPVPEQMARTVLGSFLFSGDDAFKRVGVLSGGEKSRLALVKLLLDPPNFLLMDEPTTHLDMNSIDALIDALKQFEGTLIFISHDVYFIKALAQAVLHINAGKLTPYPGNYDYYLEKSKATSERGALVAGDKAPQAVAAPKNKETSVFKTKEQKRLEAEERQAKAKARKSQQGRVEFLEKEIARLEARQKELSLQLEDPAHYDNGGVMNLNRELISVSEALQKASEEWESAAASAETASP
jgi:ATP-binding cassette subfamily F protein 3